MSWGQVLSADQKLARDVFGPAIGTPVQLNQPYAQALKQKWLAIGRQALPLADNYLFFKLPVNDGVLVGDIREALDTLRADEQTDNLSVDAETGLVYLANPAALWDKLWSVATALDQAPFKEDDIDAIGRSAGNAVDAVVDTAKAVYAGAKKAVDFGLDLVSLVAIGAALYFLTKEG